MGDAPGDGRLEISWVRRKPAVLGEKQGCAVEKDDGRILAAVKRYREDAMQQLAAIAAGEKAPIMRGTTREEAVRILTENIAAYDEAIQRLEAER
ncbi:MAG TPA: hypothetical protein VKS78_17480 [Roseiarcus sp.]|nr:hypothetical protein [Roseiarcus sp.]